MFKILIFGLPGTGKTTFGKKLIERLTDLKILYLNADEIREKYNDWDFSEEGRIRQANRMYDLSNNNEYNVVICDFVCPYNHIRTSLFKDFYKIYLNTLTESRFSNTNLIFENPIIENVDIQIDSYVKIEDSVSIVYDIIKNF